MLVKVYASACCGIEALTVTIEVDVSPGLQFFLVGLPDVAVRESQQRIATALECLGLRLPGRRIVVNMAPADLRKEGSAYDLPIAIGILAASGQLSAKRLEKVMCMGELALDGRLRPVKGALSIAIHAKECGFEACIFPEESAREAACVEGIEVYAMTQLSEVVDWFEGFSNMEALKMNNDSCGRNHLVQGKCLTQDPDFSRVMGQAQAKRALEVAAAGGHNVLLDGSPGVGKTFMAQCLPGILPPLTKEEALETTRIYSAAGLSCTGQNGLIYIRPFRAPHHSASLVSLTGGGTMALPGEMSLAHNGVLYLDELPEFPRSVIEVLRQPMEDHFIRLSRARYKVEYPAHFMLVASMNPCPCGYAGHPQKECICTPYQVARYRSRVSGPLMDRLDMHLKLMPVDTEALIGVGKEESSESIRQRVVAARERQTFRLRELPHLHCNAQIPPSYMQTFCATDAPARALLKAAIGRLQLSARAYHRILRLSRSIADLDDREMLRERDVAEALQYR